MSNVMLAVLCGAFGSYLLLFIATWLFSQRWPLLAVPLGLNGALSLTLVWKFCAFLDLPRLHSTVLRGRNYIKFK